MFLVTEEWFKCHTSSGVIYNKQKIVLGFKSKDSTPYVMKSIVGRLISPQAKELFEKIPLMSKRERSKAVYAMNRDVKTKEYDSLFKMKDGRDVNFQYSYDFVKGDEFLKSIQWARLRMKVLTERGSVCECCGSTAKDGVRICVDHIKPRKFFPELALTPENLQILCDLCNFGKGNVYDTDWR